MAAKKDKGGVDALRGDVQALADAFWSFRDAMLTDAAVRQAEEQQAAAAGVAGGAITATEREITEAATLLAAIGHPVRLRLIVRLAEEPVSVTKLVEELGLKTTGAAYHHLNVLITNGIVVQPQRGTFALSDTSSSRVHQVLGALFGVAANDGAPETGGKKKKKA